jgi:hypothetical protein
MNFEQFNGTEYKVVKNVRFKLSVGDEILIFFQLVFKFIIFILRN